MIFTSFDRKFIQEEKKYQGNLFCSVLPTAGRHDRRKDRGPEGAARQGQGLQGEPHRRGIQEPLAATEEVRSVPTPNWVSNVPTGSRTSQLGPQLLIFRTVASTASSSLLTIRQQPARFNLMRHGEPSRKLLSPRLTYIQDMKSHL